MEQARLVSELLLAVRKLGLTVRIEPFDVGGTTAGGLCTLDGHRVVILDANASLLEQAAVLAEALLSLDHESVYLAPEARLFVYARRSRP
jgi:hypothetical protein